MASCSRKRLVAHTNHGRARGGKVSEADQDAYLSYIIRDPADNPHPNGIGYATCPCVAAPIKNTDPLVKVCVFFKASSTLNKPRAFVQ